MSAFVLPCATAVTISRSRSVSALSCSRAWARIRPLGDDMPDQDCGGLRREDRLAVGNHPDGGDAEKGSSRGA